MRDKVDVLFASAYVLGMHELDPTLAESAYRADPCDTPSLSASIAKVLLSKTPKHAWLIHPRLGGEPWEPSQAMEHGEIVHAGVLGEERKLVIPKDEDGTAFLNYRKAEARRQRDEAREAGHLPILEGDFARLKLAIEGVKERLTKMDVSLTLDTARCRRFGVKTWMAARCSARAASTCTRGASG